MLPLCTKESQDIEKESCHVREKKSEKDWSANGEKGTPREGEARGEEDFGLVYLFLLVSQKPACMSYMDSISSSIVRRGILYYHICQNSKY